MGDECCKNKKSQEQNESKVVLLFVFQLTSTNVQEELLHYYGVGIGAELRIRGSIEDNSKIIFLMSHRKHML